MGALIAMIVGSVVSSWVLLAILAGIALPLGWLWMLLDALFRDESAYPGGMPGSNNRLLWVLLIFFVHVSAIAYLVMVYLPMRRSAIAAVPATA